MRLRKTAERRKSEIVEAAMRLADGVGPDRLTTEAIATAVGLTQPAVFRHFPRKQDIWEAVAARIGETMERRWARAADGATSSQRLHGVVATQLDLIRSTPAIPAILFSRELHAENADLRRAFQGLLRRFHRHLVEIVEHGRGSGDFRPDLDPSDASYLVIALVQGLALRWSLSGRGFDPVAEGERLLAILLQGFVGQTADAEANERS
ncbi:MAG: TetR family transcriptional regulator C-terminal domain-containing protein [Dongiaceae bacterium]